MTWYLEYQYRAVGSDDLERGDKGWRLVASHSCPSLELKALSWSGEMSVLNLTFRGEHETSLYLSTLFVFCPERASACSAVGSHNYAGPGLGFYSLRLPSVQRSALG